MSNHHLDLAREFMRRADELTEDDTETPTKNFQLVKVAFEAARTSALVSIAESLDIIAARPPVSLPVTGSDR